MTGHCFKRMVRLYCFILLLVLGACTPLIDPIKLRTFHGDKNSGPFETVVVYEGSIFVGGRNEIYKLDSNLEQQQIWRGKGCVSKELDDSAENIIKVLLVYKSRISLLLSCGSACRGMCGVHNITNITQSKWVGDPSDRLSYVASKSSTVAFFAPGVFDLQNLLYSAATYDGDSDLRYSPISISSKALHFTKEKGVSLVYPAISRDNVSTTSIDFSDSTKKKYIVKYVYGFSYDGYSYFITTQRVSLNTLRYETRIARVCQNDTEFFSYTEVPIQCKRAFDVYNYATAASLGAASANLKKLMKMESNEKDLLLVAFSAAPDGEAVDRKKGSVICSFRLPVIVESFTNATRNCFNAEPRTRLLEFITGVEQSCIRRPDVKIDERFCGSAFNHHIEGIEAIPGGFRTLLDKQITSIALTLQGEMENTDTVALLGTDDGYVLKVVVNRYNRQPLYAMFIGDADELDNRIRASNALDSSHSNVYLITGKKVKKFPIGSCSVYKKCSSCFTIDDPLKCQWCGSYCAHRDECETPGIMAKGVCPPVIEKVFPLMGPLQGGTLVTIDGDNFSHSQSNPQPLINVTVANIACEIILWNNTRLVCRTGNVPGVRQGPVVVDVHDKSWTIGQYDLVGNVTSSEIFQYVVPKLHSFSPSFGPKSGGTNVTLEGNLLDVGSSVKVYLAGTECSVYNQTKKEIKCTSGELHSGQKKEGLAIVEIDNANITNKANFSQSIFTYLEDPLIYDITPHKTTISGGTNITVKGKYLNSVASPEMVVSYVSSITGKRMIYTQGCISDIISGYYMICPVPPLKDHSLQSLGPNFPPVTTHMSFIMDGVALLRDLPHYNLNLSILTYYPDPFYEEFQEAGRIRKIPHEVSLLDIKGRSLSSAHGPKDVKVIIDKSSYCNVTRMTESTLWCIIPPIHKQSNETTVSVEVIAGNLKFDLGYIQFVDEEKDKANTLVAIIIPVLLGIGIIAIAIALFVRWKLSKKPFHSELMVTYTADTGPRDGSCRRRQGANDYLDMRGRRSDTTSPPSSPGLPVTYQVDDETLNLLHAENIFFLRDYLTLGKVIGQGHFGRVYKGELWLPGKEEGNSVAVKTLHNSAATGEQDVKAFLQEGLMMKDFHHHNVLTLIGVCFEADGSPMVIIPYMKYGDLLSYIRNENHFPTIKDLLQYGVQIAAGMRYLSDLKFVHRDLAARNCMLDEDYTVKVADFGLSRDIYERDYYSSDNKKTKLPVKWMAPESLEKGTYNTKTDVWSYGVVLWELMTRGVTPYPDVDNWDVLQYVKKGRRMPQPSYCPDLLYGIMLRCWSEDPKKRPPFSELEEEVQGVITKLEQKSKQRKVGLDVTYVNYPSVVAENVV